jgi:hypothetical protein
LNSAASSASVNNNLPPFSVVIRVGVCGSHSMLNAFYFPSIARVFPLVMSNTPVYFMMKSTSIEKCFFFPSLPFNTVTH